MHCHHITNIGRYILITSGWGLDTSQQKPRFLQGTEMKVVPLQECQNTLIKHDKRISKNFKFNDESICVKDGHLDSTVCYGDSGG